MGASSFYCVASGSSANTAFNQAVEDAQYEFGHGGYTGTIAEKSSYKSASIITFASKKEAYTFAEDTLSDMDHWACDKWGPAAYVSFKDKEEIKYLFFGYASE